MRVIAALRLPLVGGGGDDGGAPGANDEHYKTGPGS